MHRIEFYFIGCNIWINHLQSEWNNLSGILQLCEFKLTIHSLVKPFSP